MVWQKCSGIRRSYLMIREWETAGVRGMWVFSLMACTVILSKILSNHNSVMLRDYLEPIQTKIIIRMVTITLSISQGQVPLLMKNQLKASTPFATRHGFATHSITQIRSRFRNSNIAVWRLMAGRISCACSGKRRLGMISFFDAFGDPKGWQKGYKVGVISDSLNFIERHYTDTNARQR